MKDSCMKRVFSSALVLPFLFSLNVFAQGEFASDYESSPDAEPLAYGNDSLDSSSEQRGEIQVETKQEKPDYFSNLQPVVLEPSKKKFYMGTHVGIGFAGTYANEKAKGYYYNTAADNFEFAEKDPFDGYSGFVFDLGASFVIHLTDRFALAPELICHILNYYKESDVWYLNRGLFHAEPLKENMTLADVSIPVLGRAYFTKALFAEFGAQFNFNVYGSFTLENSDYNFSEKVGGWSGEFFGVGLDLGLGYSFDLLSCKLEPGARFMIDFTRMEADDEVLNGANGSYRYAVGTKAWTVQIFINYYRL